MNALWETLDRLEGGRRWVKWTAYENGSRCLLGAIGNAGPSDDYMSCVATPDEVAAAEAVAEVIRSQFPDRAAGNDYWVSDCRRFNDHPETTFDDVRVVLEKAAIAHDEILS